jgi:glutathione reductase (NADPH)
VDEYQNTSAEGVFALGDVCGNIELTPMAIAAGRRLADRYASAYVHVHVHIYVPIYLCLPQFSS